MTEVKEQERIYFLLFCAYTRCKDKVGLLSDELMSWQTTIKDKVCLNSGKRCLSAEECNALWMQRKRIFLLFFCSLSLHPIGSILYFYELLVLCALQKNVLQCPREALRRSTPPFRSLLVCSSFFVPAVGVRWSFQLSNWITSSNSSLHSEHDRSDSREDFWEGRRALIVFFPPTGASTIPNVSAWNTSAQTTRTKTNTSIQTLHLSPTQGSGF